MLVLLLDIKRLSKPVINPLQQRVKVSLGLRKRSLKLFLKLGVVCNGVPHMFVSFEFVPENVLVKSVVGCNHHSLYFAHGSLQFQVLFVCLSVYLLNVQLHVPHSHSKLLLLSDFKFGALISLSHFLPVWVVGCVVKGKLLGINVELEMNVFLSEFEEVVVHKVLALQLKASCDVAVKYFTRSLFASIGVSSE